MSEETVPKSLNDLSKQELLVVAEAFGTTASGNKAEVIADLVESGVTIELYLQKFRPNLSPVEPTVEETTEGGEEVTDSIVTAPQQSFSEADKYLVKFVGENPYFEFGKHKFTQDNPYGIMTARDAQKALSKEPTKFRQAYPDELQEFYS